MIDLAWVVGVVFGEFSFTLRKVRTAEQMSGEKTIWRRNQEKEDTDKKGT